MNQKSADMKRATGVSRRVGSTNWQWAIKPPKDLKDHFPGQWAHRCSLDTSDLLEANSKAAQLHIEWHGRFADLRRVLNPVPVATITPELGATLGGRIRSLILTLDDKVRDNPVYAEFCLSFADTVRAVSLRPLMLGPLETAQGPSPAEIAALRMRSPFDGLTPTQASRLAQVNEGADSVAGQQLAARQLSAVLPMADAEARKLGLLINWTTPEARPLLLECLKASRAAFADVVQRDKGHDISTPPVVTAVVSAPKVTAKPKTLRDVYDRWAVSGEEKRTIINKNACNSALELFEGFAPGTALEAITRNQGDAFRAWLRDRPGASKTARSKLTYVKSLLKFACQTLEWIPKHPWVGLEIKAATQNPRRPWATPELQLLFSSPLHTAYLLPTHWRAGGAAGYWIPLLGLFTGARMGELCQLRTGDVQAIEGIPVLVITDDGDGQQIKSRAGRRTLPIHSELLRLGFLEYVQAMRAAGEDALWPTLRHRLGKPSGYYSEWFSTHRKAQGLTESRPDFHCFRHTVRPLMRRAGFSESTMDKITGHEHGGSIGSVVYDHFTLEEIQKAIEAIQYPDLVLPVVSPHKVR